LFHLLVRRDVFSYSSKNFRECFLQRGRRKKFFAIEPGVFIVNVYDPIISSVGFSFLLPIWRKKAKEEVYKLWRGSIGGEIFFIINEKFSYFTNLNVLIAKTTEIINVEVGVSYYSKPNHEWRIYLLNNYDGMMWSSYVGISYGLFSKYRRKTKDE